MRTSKNLTVDIKQARAFLASYYGSEPSPVGLVGEGAWSRCFGYRRDGQDLVIRFGKFVDDFRKDRFAQRFTAPGVPVPEVLEIGQAYDGFYAIATRAHGSPLDEVGADQWNALVPSVVDALEAMRTADIPPDGGIGSWGPDGKAGGTRWSERLLSVAVDTPDLRSYGWRAKLAASPSGDGDFIWGYDLLQETADDSIPIGLVHGDLMNRNVLVEGSNITGVFDWGCSVYGDHLYDLAWFEFWAPWYPDLDIGRLRPALERRWEEAGYVPENKAARLAACYLHIGLDHLAYNAHLEDWDTLAATAAQMRALVTGV